MTFQREQIKEFLVLFESVKSKIRSFEGCEHLELWRDKTDERVFFTYSIWNSQSDLDRYRFSGLFKDTWSATRKSFAENAEAYSIERLITA